MFPTQVPGANELSHDGVLYLAPVGSVGTPLFPAPIALDAIAAVAQLEAGAGGRG